MQKFDILLATPEAEIPSKRKFSMMEAKPAPRETKETPSVRRRSLRLVKPMAEAEEVKHVASIRKSVAEALRPLNEVDKLRAKTKSLKGRIETLLGHPVKGKTAEEIRSNISLGDKFSAWLGKIAGKKTESSSLSELLNQLNLAEKTLEVKLTPDISVVEPAAPPRKPRTLRSIKSRLDEAKAKSESLEADKALENLNVEVIEPEIPKENIGSRIERAKAGLKRAEIKTSPLAESVRMPQAEEEIEIPVHFEEEVEPAIDLKEQLSEIGVEDKALVYGYLDNPDIKQKSLKLVELFKAEEAKTSQLEEEITNLEKERDEALDKTTDKASQKSIARQYSQKISRARQTINRSGQQWQKDYESRKADLENLAKAAQGEGETKRGGLAEEITEEKFAGAEAKGIESKFWNDSLERLNNRVSSLSKSSMDYTSLAKLKNNPKISKQVLELVRQDVNQRIKDDARLTEESLLKEDFETRISQARQADDKKAEAAIKAEHDKSLQAFQKQTLDLAYQWATKYEKELDKIAAKAKDIEEEAALPEAEIIKEKSPSEIAPPPPTASERKRKSEFLDAIAGKTGTTIEVGTGELTPEEIKAAYGEDIKFEEPKVQFEAGVAQDVAARREKIMKTPTLRIKEKADVYQDLRQELRERVKDGKQIEDYISLANKRDRAYKDNDEQTATALQKRIDTFNTAWREVGILGKNEDPSVTTTGKSGIGHMGVIGSELITKRMGRGGYTEVLPSGAREKTRSKLEKTRAIETKELQPFNTAWAMERLGNGAAKRWDLVAPVIMERKLGPVIAREINSMVQEIEKLDESEKNLLSDEYQSLPKMMGIVRNTQRFDQSPEAAAYVFLRALRPESFSDFLAQDIVEATLNKLDQEIAKAEQESNNKKAEKRKQEEQGFSAMRAKPSPRGTEPKVETKNKPAIPKTKKARTIRAQGKSEAA